MSTAETKSTSIDRFARVCGFTPDPAKLAAIAEFKSMLQTLSPTARKLLAHIADLATRPHAASRRKNAAYLPELHETCGLDPEPMFELLEELKAAHAVQIEGEYPYQDILLVTANGWPLLADLARFTTAEKLSLRDLLADRKFDLLR
ncbi:MAG TPA: hypothetical protein VF753_09030 [Terriglobales bacterium]